MRTLRTRVDALEIRQRHSCPGCKHAHVILSTPTGQRPIRTGTPICPDCGSPVETFVIKLAFDPGLPA